MLVLLPLILLTTSHALQLTALLLALCSQMWQHCLHLSFLLPPHGFGFLVQLRLESFKGLPIKMTITCLGRGIVC